jgi:hypothetical protein
MVQQDFAIELYLACVAEKKFTWNEVRKFAHNSTRFGNASDEEILEVFERIKINYPHGHN